jgi:NhaP-type Na+/H+ or K+/H+ antiporter
VKVLVFIAIAAGMLAMHWYWPLACYVCLLVGAQGGRLEERANSAR